MSQADQQKLLALVPDLRHIAAQPPARTISQAQAAVACLRAEVMEIMDNQTLSPDEPFMGGLTLGQYQALPDEEKGKLWDEWADMDLMELEEREVNPDALSAG
jgi:hypothetical protein